MIVVPAAVRRAAPDPTRRVDKFLPVVVRDVDEERKIIIFRGTTSTPDREGDIVVPQGGKFQNYRKNPVFLWAHDWRGQRLPIGKSLGETIIPDVGVDYEIQFDDKDLFAMEVFRKYKEGYLNAVSIGFLPIRWEYLEGSGDEWARGIRYNEWEQLELSGVPIPANPEALQHAMSRFLAAGGQDDECKHLAEILSAEWGVTACSTAKTDEATVYKKAWDEWSQGVLAEVETMKNAGALPVKVEVHQVPKTVWICPHCNKEIGEKELFAGRVPRTWIHGPCKGFVTLPRERPEAFSVAPPELPFDWDPDTEIVILRRTGQQFTLGLLEQLDVEAIREAVLLRDESRQLKSKLSALGMTEDEAIRLLKIPVPSAPQPREDAANIIARIVADAVEERVSYLQGRSYVTTGKPPKILNTRS